MSAVILFSESTKLPAYLSAKNPLLTAINRDVVSSGPTFSVLSIKGKVFTLVRGEEKKLLTRDVDGEQEPVQSVQLSVVRANTRSRVFYAKAYTEGDSDGAKPTCFSNDGDKPDPEARDPQSKKCQTCPHAVWGSKAGTEGKGTACAVNTRLAVIDPSNIGEPFLLRVPPASRKNFQDAVKAAETRQIPYNAMVMRVSFDKEAPSPKLVFKPVGLVSDEAYGKISGMYEDEMTKAVVGLHVTAEAEANVDVSELDAAIAAKQAVSKAASKPAPVVDVDDISEALEPAAPKAKAAPKEVAPAVEKPAEKPAPKAKKPKVAEESTEDILSALDDMLDASDD